MLAHMEAVMTVTYSTSHILVKTPRLHARDVDRLNEILDEAGLGRPLRHPEAGAPPAGWSGLAVLPLAGADPMAVRDTVRAAAAKGGGDLPSLILNHQYDAGTEVGKQYAAGTEVGQQYAAGTEVGQQHAAGTEVGERNVKLFSASGKKSGHGLVAWLPAPAYEMPPSKPLQESPRPPVIALLDSGVQLHNWLPENGGPPSVVDAEAAYGWKAPMLPPDPEKISANPDYGTHWGHATFITGLIRKEAPGAQVLSMRVMDVAGKVSELNVADALEWLATTDKVKVDIVLMAFGRRERPGDHDLENLRGPIRKLANRRVRIVASAGNDGSDRPVYPAAFAAEQGLAVVSVGALATPTERAPYSNFGPWVHRWGKGTNVISIMPLTSKGVGMEPAADLLGAGPAPHPGDGYAWWSGTSFAAATCAGKLVARSHSGQALPEPAAGA
jgi:hypothetical protein